MDIEKKKQQNIITKKDLTLMALFSAIFGFGYSVADNLWHKEIIGVTWSFLPASILSFLVLTCVYFFIEKNRAFNKTKRTTQRTGQSVKRLYFLFFVLVFASYMICFLTFYPGVGMNDILNLLWLGGESSGVIPPYYAMYVSLFVPFGINHGALQHTIAVLSFVQLTCCAFAVAGIMLWLYKQNLPKVLKYFLIIYYIVSPILAMYSISMVKDTMFSVALTLLSISIIDIINNPKIMDKNFYWIILGIICVLMVMLRNNGPYIVFALLLVFLLRYKKHWLKISCISLLVMLTIFGGQAIRKAYDASQEFQESVAIPLQQICGVIASDGEINQEQLNFMNDILTVDRIKSDYDPYCSDSIKWNNFFNRDFLSENKREFFKTWLDLLPANFSTYVKAYLQETFWFWAPIQEGEVQVFYTIENYGGDTGLEFFAKSNLIHESPKLPKVIAENLKKYYSLSSYMLREGVCWWICIMCAFIQLIKSKKLQSILWNLPVFLLHITLMISAPISYSFRYVLVFAYILPICFSELFTIRD